MATKPQKYADGGQVGLQPTLALADGGSLDQNGKGPWTGDLNSNTSTFNQDFLRGPNFGSTSSAGLVNYAPSTPSVPGVSQGSANAPPLSPQQQALLANETPEQRDQRISTDMSGVPGSVAMGALNAIAPGLGKVATIAKGAYDMYNGAMDPRDTSNTGFAAGLGRTIGDALGTDPGYASGPVNATKITQATDQAAQGDTAMTAAGMLPTANNTASNGGPRTAPSFNGTQNGSDASGVGGGYGGDNTHASAADGGMAVPGGFQRAGQPGALPGVGQPPGPPGLQMPGQQAPAAPAGPMHPALANLHVQNKLANPQVMQAIKTHLDQAIQSGQLNPQQLQMMGQLAQSAIQHPELWPKLRQFAIQAGMPDAQQLPMQFNQGIAMALMAASHASQHGDRPGAFADGGMLHGQGSGTSDSIPAQNHSTGQPVKLSNGEYIIPADVVATKGKEFFDNIVRKYHTPAALQHGR